MPFFIKPIDKNNASGMMYYIKNEINTYNINEDGVSFGNVKMTVLTTTNSRALYRLTKILRIFSLFLRLLLL